MRAGGNRPTGARRVLAIGAGFVLAALAPIATTVGAAASTAIGLTVGSITNATAPLAGEFVKTGDMIAAGWDISMPENHPATTVALSGATATIPFLCLTESTPVAKSLVILLPTTSISIPANDTSWHPTSSSSSVAGYQASAAVPLLCADGVLIPKGNITYAATLVSADTTNTFAMRFHAVDARAFVVSRDVSRSDSGREDSWDSGQHESENTNCASPTQNTGLERCKAAWTNASTNTAAAPPSTGGGSGGASGGGSGSGSSGGSGMGAGSGGKSAHLPGVVVHRSATRVATLPSTAQASAVKTPVTAPIPALVLPAPSPTPTVLGPVPLMVPVIDATASQVGAALPWTWFALFALVDLGLIVGVVLRRRRGAPIG
jgi:hypothetical protein